MIFFVGFSVASKAILEYIGQEAALKDAKKGAKSTILKWWDNLMDTSSLP